MQDLGTLGGANSVGWGINNSGEIAGSSYTANGIDDPFSWTLAGGMKDLLPRHVYYTGGRGYAINRYGNIAGWVYTKTTIYPALWTANGLTLLPTLGGTSAFAYGINGNNHVVGYSATTSNTTHAFLWTQANGIVDLGTLGGANSVAYGINRVGQVVGTADLP
jgi:probable HAF family extracellular repeat protein